ncbi:MAG: hypothetical protein ACD_4C00308G0009 [uncultured bacterium (gcode 4)]|uniref:Uncharacterized protein n=1 Tax=uncultured bacterium (gcode 4) TaxID=1234023 RepID=K2F5M3_9BACT|nr:MAG: hypothetical protein ACD_4C00308G0009 [uncultured bacterium (gcode 4)]
MWIFDMFDKNACSINWRNNWLESWSWIEFKEKKKDLWDKLILVDMIWHPMDWSVPISDKLFSWIYPDWTIFALYCHSWWSSWYLQMQLAPKLPQFVFINIKWGILNLN